MATGSETYAARLQIDYSEQLDRFTTFFRLFWIIPIGIILALITAAGDAESVMETGERVSADAGGVAAGLAVATALMIVFRQRYPRWWFDFARELARFSARVGAYFALLTDQYPSTVEEQSVHLQIQYPNAEADLNRILPIFKWLLAIPHYIALAVLGVLAFLVTILAWVLILLTGRYPQGLFKFVVGVLRWGTRVGAYAFLLTTDRYPPFSLSE